MNKNRIIFLTLPILCALYTISCRTTIVYSGQSLTDRLSEKDLNLKSFITYLQSTNRNCSDTCKFTIDSYVNYFDDCMVSMDSMTIVNAGYDRKKELNYFFDRYLVPNLGRVKFSPSEYYENTYHFAPVVFVKERNIIYGQVNINDNRREFYSIKVLGDEFLFELSTEYYFTCAPWY